MKAQVPPELKTSSFRGMGPPLLLLCALLGGCAHELQESPEGIFPAVEEIIAESGKEIAVYYRSLGDGDSLLINPDLRMHAASTMKVPVMIQLYLDRDAGLLSLEDSLEVVTTFSSIVDGSPYELAFDPETDGDLPERIGGKVSYSHLVELMITLSSNLATNILIQEADARRVTAAMREMGADSIEVLRGVEDGPAFRAGLSNTTTARDLGVIMEALGRGDVGAPGTSAEMLEILSRQHWRTKIPALLPAGTRVAHKTGRITGISHDSGIVFPEGAPPYVLIILTRGFEDGEEADAAAARISRLIFDDHTRQESSHDE
jgi:beta-lactamase class A